MALALIYPQFLNEPGPAKFIIIANGDKLYVQGGNVYKRTPLRDEFTLVKTPKKILEKAQKFMETAPAELKKVLKLERFKWVKLK